MKVVMVSGFLNNHLLPLCLAFQRDCAFQFVATEDFENKETGSLYNRNVLEKDFVIKYYLLQERERAIKAVQGADVVIFGGSSSELLQVRKKSEKLCFLYTERFLKKGAWRRFIPTTYRKIKNILAETNNNLFVLCASSYVVQDLSYFGFPVTHCFKFGYFPQINKFPLENLLAAKRNMPVKFLYVGRLLKCKRVQDVIVCWQRLREQGIVFTADILGDGPERDNLEKLTRKLGMENHITFHGGCSFDIVSEYMFNSNLLFFSSNYYEGWGAVVNESLAHACPVVGSDAAGSIRYLLKDRINGVVYQVANIDNMVYKTRQLLDKGEEKYIAAYQTVYEEWSAEIACCRFVEIAEKILQNKPYNVYTHGPMSLH